MRITATSALLLALLAACGEQFDAGEFDVGDTWTGTAEIVRTVGETTDTATYGFTLDLDQSEDDITGSGQVQGEAETVDVEINGTWRFPAVDFVMTSPGFAALRFQANFDVDSTFTPGDTLVIVSPDSLIGTLSGSGFPSVRMDIGRQNPVGTQ